MEQTFSLDSAETLFPLAFDSDTDSVIVTHRRQEKRHLQRRSKKGCWTCRERKVKCDEIHPQCGPCTRVRRGCHFEREWKFCDLRVHIQRQHDHIKTSGSPAWEQHMRKPTNHFEAWNPTGELHSASKDVTDKSDGGIRCLSRNTKFFNLIFTPNSFAKLPEYRGPVGCRYKNSPDPGSSEDVPMHGSDFAILSRFEDTGSPEFLPPLPEHSGFTLGDTARAFSPPSVSLGLMSYSAETPVDHLLHYRVFVSPRIMPLGMIHKLCFDGEVDTAVLSHSRSFEPLYHAICAISSLSLVFKGQQSFLVEAFQHYDWAISTCIEYTCAGPSSLFYLHFVLLIYDICCAAQSTLDQDMWAQHLDHLARLAYRLREDELDKTQVYMLWYILYLDTQSYLAGNEEAGSCVRAYLADDSFLPTWTQFQHANQDLELQNDSGASFAVYDLAQYVCKQFAELSELAWQIRKETNEGRGNVHIRRKCIDEFHYNLYSGWTRRYQKILEQTSSEAGLWLDPLLRMMLDFVNPFACLLSANE
ncbi:hypothetical protein E4T45_05880 [Aureobasidium sp. EXF-8846]|nr:hypothetical protein E4T45_05880 [Aureobasidium sp. EXF-8846]